MLSELLNNCFVVVVVVFVVGVVVVIVVVHGGARRSVGAGAGAGAGAAAGAAASAAAGADDGGGRSTCGHFGHTFILVYNDDRFVTVFDPIYIIKVYLREIKYIFSRSFYFVILHSHAKFQTGSECVCKCGDDFAKYRISFLEKVLWGFPVM